MARKVHIFLVLNQKVEVIKDSKKILLKAQGDCGPLYQRYKLRLKRTSTEGN